MNNRVAKKYKKAIEKAYNLLETDVTIYKNLGRNPNIEWDNISNEPVNPDDVGSEYLTEVVFVKGIGRWNRTTILQKESAGTIFVEEYYLNIRAKDIEINPADPSLGTILEDATKIIIDKVKFKIKNPPQKMGVPEPYDYFVVLERAT